MATAQRFCDECGKPLTPGVKFCEECGVPVTSPGSLGQGAPQPPVPPESPEVPVAVLPFAYQQRGIFSTDRCTLVVYPDRVVIAFAGSARIHEYEQAMTAVSALQMEKHLNGKNFWQVAAGAGNALFRDAGSMAGFSLEDPPRDQKILHNSTLSALPWKRYLSMAPEEVLAEDSRNMALPRESISHIRGESDPSTDTDQILIYTSGGLTRLFFECGIYFLARKVLLSFLLPATGTPERMIGVIPSANEPQVKGFGFQYTWILVVTANRVLFCMVEDDIAEEITAWIEGKETEAKKAGRKIREGELAGLPDAPWQELMKGPVPPLLENDVNFFIPLSSIRSARLISGGPRQGDTISFELLGGPFSIRFPEGTAGHIRAVLGPALQERFS